MSDPPPAILHIATATCEIGRNWCKTTLADGSELTAIPEDTDAYRQTARDHGYGADTGRLCVDHELMHQLLAQWLGLPESPVIAAVIDGTEATNLTRLEERAVLSIQAFAMALGVSIQEIARAR